MDTKRKGRNMHCETCNRVTRHVFLGNIEKKNISKDDYGRTHTGKVNWFQCVECGDTRIIDRWS